MNLYTLHGTRRRFEQISNSAYSRQFFVRLDFSGPPVLDNQDAKSFRLRSHVLRMLIIPGPGRPIIDRNCVVTSDTITCLKNITILSKCKHVVRLCECD